MRQVRLRAASSVVTAAHTLVWAVFVASIVAIPVYASLGNLMVAWGLPGFVPIEVAVLLANRMRCPLTDVAGRHTAVRRENFDIYLPLWLARTTRRSSARCMSPASPIRRGFPPDHARPARRPMIPAGKSQSRQHGDACPFEE